MQRDINIFQIPVAHIEPHPQNPRKDLGDLTELCDSIRKNGIMQNLTVVPLDDSMTRFRCVIGHRRLAAAKEVGLFAVPATIAENMDEREQLATMIAENMQRADLTLPEQVGAVQLMLDLGEDIDSVVERTGLAKSTVKQRAKIAGLTDNATLTKAWDHGVTLMQIEQIAKIKDPQRRAALWEKSTGKYFDREISAALYEEELEEFEKRVKKLLEDAGVQQVPDGDVTDMRWVQNIARYNEPKTVAEIKSRYNDPNATYYYTFGYGSFSIYFKSPQIAAAEDKYDAMTRWKMRVNTAERAFFDRQNDFITEAAKREETDFRKPLTYYLDMLLEYVGKEQRVWLSSAQRNDFIEVPTQIGKVFILAIETVRVTSITDYNGKRNKDNVKRALDLIDMLKAEGYEPTDLEVMYFNGTHEIWSEKPTEDKKE